MTKVKILNQMMPEPMRSNRIRACIALLLLMLAPAATGQEADPTTRDCRLPSMSLHERPDPNGTVTEVSIGVALVDLRKINDPDQTVAVDLLITLGWRDPRLVALDGCRVPADRLWQPQLEIINSGTMDARSDRTLAIGVDGQVRKQTRINGVFTTPLDISEFPFDDQLLRLEAMSIRYTIRELALSIDQRWTAQSDKMTIPDWKVGQVGASVREFYAPQLEQTYSRYELTIPVQRRHEFFVYKLILPLCMIVVMSWSLFWIHPVQIGPRMGVAVTSMLTLIAFQFAMGDVLPRVSYFTVMDQFILGSSALVFLALVEGVLTSYLAMEEKKKAGRLINRIARIAFPTAFAAILAGVFLFR